MTSQVRAAPETTPKRRVLPPTYLLLAVVTMVVLHVLVPWRHVIPFPWSFAGLVPFVLGVILNLIADADLKRSGTTVKPFEDSSSLVTTGAYRICRNPMYLGFALILIGLALLIGSATPFVIVPVFIALVEVTFIRVEERMLEERFGDVWRSYAARVPRWIGKGDLRGEIRTGRDPDRRDPDRG
jgi:protein-S-isoprenylcysteine O-methyltransferase Ste14